MAARRHFGTAREATVMAVRLRPRLSLCFSLILCLCFAVASFSAASPRTAFANASGTEALTFASINIEATAETDGSLHVIERRVVEPQGAIGTLVWVLDELPEGASLEVRGVRVAPVDAEGNVVGDWAKLPATAFVLDWRGGSGGPSAEAYSYDSPKNTLYVFAPNTAARSIVEIEYDIIAGIEIYDDMAQINWRYVSETWSAYADDLSLTIALPLPPGVAAVSGSNVYAWGHGPAEGELSVGSDGVVAFATPHLDAGRFAEARVLFPQSWLTNLSPQAAAARLDGNIRDAAISEEGGWTDQAVFWRKWDMGVIAASAGLSAVALLLAVAVYRLRGKPFAVAAARVGEPIEPAAAGTVALEPLAPAVAGRLLRWNEQHVHDLTATVVSLVRRGVVSVEDPAVASRADLRLKLNDEEAARLTCPIDLATLELLFNTIGEGSRTLKLGAVYDFAQASPAAFVHMIDHWQRVLSDEVARLGLFDSKSLNAQKVLGAEALVVFAVGIAVTAALGNPVPVAFAAPTALAIGVMANYVPRRSREAAALLARYEQQMSRMSDRGLVSAYLPQPEELARLTDALDGVLENSFANAQTIAAKQRVAASRQGSFGGTYKA
ncbi:MAG: DUF2207 domain-containing protein [Eggerthellaceae bacterium]|nr:DUF2207 domain-containing protein [Eggerthellaceae bacterium]